VEPVHLVTKGQMKNQITEPISLDESKRLINLEKIIKEGVATFITVGDALAEIKDSRLYRADFPTFQAYCDKTWNFTRMRAYQLIEASEVHKALPANVKTSFTNPHQLNALAKLPKAKRIPAAKAIIKAAKKSGGRITAKTVKAEVAKQLPRGGLTADAIRAQRGDKPAAMRGIDMSKVDRVDSLLPNPVLPPDAKETIEVPMKFPAVSLLTVLPQKATQLTPKRFQELLDELEAMIPADCDHAKFGVIANKMAERQMNFKIEKSTFAYGR